MAKQIKQTPEANKALGVNASKDANETPAVKTENAQTANEQVPVVVEDKKVTAEPDNGYTSQLESKVKELEEDLSSAYEKIKSLTESLQTAEQQKEKALENFTKEAISRILAENRVKELENTLDSLEQNNETVDVEEEPKDHFVYKGKKYGFNDRAPKKLYFEDRVCTQEELLNDEEAMISLIVGENAFIKIII